MTAYGSAGFVAAAAMFVAACVVVSHSREISATGSLPTSGKGADNVDMVQSFISRSGEESAPYDLPTPAPTEPNNSSNNSSNNSANITTPAPTPYPPLYQIVITRTYGGDHHCLTEIEFYDVTGAQVKATQLASTTCYGCAINCAGCTVNYGNPNAQFDGVADVDKPSAWSCSDVGAYNSSGYGEQTITFELTHRPVRYVIRRPNINGITITRDWRLMEQQGDGSWEIISSVFDAGKNLSQPADVQPSSGIIGKWWLWAPPQCSVDWPPEGAKSPQPASSATLEWLYTPKFNLALSNNGRGIYVDGEFGYLTLPDGAYVAKQVHFIYPSKRTLPNTDPAVDVPIDMRIVHQKLGTPRGSLEDIAVIVVPLRLANEKVDLETYGEKHLHEMFSPSLPIEGAPKPLKMALNLTNWMKELDGKVKSIPCPPEGIAQKWFVTEPAPVTGQVVLLFKERFPPELLDEQSTTTSIPEAQLTALARLGYNQLGRQQYVNPLIADAPDSIIENVTNETIFGTQEVQWVPNPWYVQGAADWMAAGEWGIPPPTPAPTTPEMVRRRVWTGDQTGQNTFQKMDDVGDAAVEATHSA